MYLRYFCEVSDSPAGTVALAYLRSLVRIAPVRVIDPRGHQLVGALPGGWNRFTSCLMTPMAGTFINIVCTAPDRWTWLQKVSAPKKNERGSETVTITGRCELYTSGARNVLISDAAFESLSEEERATAAKYDALITPLGDLALWLPATTVIPIPVKDHAAMSAVVLGTPR